MKEFFTASKRGLPITRHGILKGLEILGYILFVIGILSAPFITNLVDNPVEKGLIWFGFICLLAITLIPIMLSPYFGMREMKRDIEKDLKSTKNQLEEWNPLASIKQSQNGNETSWLYLSVDWIDIEKRNNMNERDIQVKFSIDSGLLYEFKPHKLWVSLIIAGIEPRQPQYEFIGFPNLLPLKRTTFGGKTLTINENETDMLEAIKQMRAGTKYAKGLKVEIQLKNGETPIALRSEPTY